MAFTLEAVMMNRITPARTHRSLRSWSVPGPC